MSESGGNFVQHSLQEVRERREYLCLGGVGAVTVLTFMVELKHVEGTVYR